MRGSCWFCSHRFTVAGIERDGIIRSRRQNLGGPYRLLVCPQCNRENICEKTNRGRWFASPNLRISIMEYFFSQLLDTRPEDFLAAATWFKENEVRRRYFFERDGDSRYSGRWRNRFWPHGSESSLPGGAREASRPREAGADEARAAASETEKSESRRQKREEKRRAASASRRRLAHILSPYAILEVSARASASEIRAAFRRLATLYHPDKVYHLGEEAQRLAHEKFTRLKAAYDALIERQEREEQDRDA